MPSEVQGLAPCKGSCGEITIHDSVRPVSRGHLYIRCRVCGHIYHIEKPPKERTDQ